MKRSPPFEGNTREYETQEKKRRRDVREKAGPAHEAQDPAGTGMVNLGLSRERA